MLHAPYGAQSAITLALLTAALLAACVVSLVLGSTSLSWHQVLKAVLGGGDSQLDLIVLQMRLPRMVLGVLIGAGLAVSGVVLQGVSRNDLASPDTLGINGGSGLGILVLLSAMPTATTRMPLLLPLGAVVGALAILALVLLMAYHEGRILPARLLLVGVAVGFAAHAAMLVLSLRMNFVTYNYVLTWMSGTLAAADWSSILLLLPCAVFLFLLALARAHVLNVLTLGEHVATGLGAAVERDRRLLLAVAAMLTSVCAAIGGQIGFLGLAAPHLARRLVGRNHLLLLPAAALAGATLLVLADGLARSLFSPAEMPAGVVVGILGGVYFLYLLATTRG